MSDLTKSWLTQDFFHNPHPYFAELRAEAPLYWSDKLNMWITTNHALTLDALRDHTRFSNSGRMEAEIATLPLEERQVLTKLAEDLGVGLIHSDPPDHTRMRRIVGKTFTPRVIEALRERTAGLADGLIDKMLEHKEFDFIEAFAFPLPVLVISDLFGVPREDAERIKVWSEAITDLGSRRLPLYELGINALKATAELKEYFLVILEARRIEPREDLITLLLQAEDGGDQLSRSELIGMAILILVAGHETTTSLLSNGLLLLMQNPEQMKQVQADPSLLPGAIEEMLRMEPSFPRTPRRIKEDMEFGGCQLRKDQMLSAMNAAANRDPEVFPEPDQFNIRRSPNKHLAFGHGVHHCLGAPLARLEASLAFSTLLRRLPNLRLADDDICYKPDFSTRRLERLNVKIS